MATKAAIETILVKPLGSDKLVDLKPYLPDFTSIESVLNHSNQVGVQLDSARLTAYGNSPVTFVATYTGKDGKPFTKELNGETILRYDEKIDGKLVHQASPRDGSKDYNPMTTRGETATCLGYLLARIHLGGRNSSIKLIRAMAYALATNLGQYPSITVKVGGKMESHDPAKNRAMCETSRHMWINEFTDIVETEGLGVIGVKSGNKHAEKIRNYDKDENI